MAREHTHSHGSPENPAALAQEARFWGTVTRLLLESGAIPYDIDRQRAEPIRNRQVLRELGSRRADPEIEERWRGQVVDDTLRLLKKASPRRVLELGCGAGWLSLEMARSGLAVEAIDVSAERIETARLYYAERGEVETLAPVSYEIQDLEHWTPIAGGYDAAVSFTTLHHIRDKRGLLERCYNALPPGGTLIVFDDEHDAGAWPARVFRSLVVLGLGLSLLPLPSPVPRTRRLLEATFPLAESTLSAHVRERLRGLVAPILWRGRSGRTLAHGSPFEGVHDEDHSSLEELVSSVFDDVRITRRESFGLRQLAVVDAPRPMKALLVKFLYALDQTFAGSAWLPGTALWIVATKRPRGD